MSEYFKTYTESHDGDEGVFYCEVENGLIIRHVSVFGSIYYWATPEDSYDELYDFTDQPEFDVDDEEAESISRSVFDGIWDRAMSQQRIEK